ncbi:Fungalysin/Thermolysin Extracellular metalloproteinase 5 [Tulasnella sp. 417]|nr:Fungalysin/Thermolysin Extracellular metalloproteinase 5 [Tulasnella sp. 417]
MRSLFLSFLFPLGRVDSGDQEKSVSLSFGPPAAHSSFNTAPLNSSRRPSGDNVDSPASILAFAKWYILNSLNYPADSWRVAESDLRQDASSVWRVDVKQVAHNGMIEIVDGNLSLNILNGSVISYGDSFFRGSSPDLVAPPSGFDDFDPEFTPIPRYNLETYCRMTGQFARQHWVQENPKWRDWYSQFSKSRNARDGRFDEVQGECQQNIERAYEKCIQEQSADPDSTSWFQRAKVLLERSIMFPYSSRAYSNLKCHPLRWQTPLDLEPPPAFQVATTYNEGTCIWDFVPDFSTVDIDFYLNSKLEQMIQGDKSELMEKQGILDPAIAAVLLLVSFPHGEKGAVWWDIMGKPGIALRRIERIHRPERGRYVFELQNVLGADGSVNATLVYVQTPPRQSHRMFNFEEDDNESGANLASSLTRAWKLSIQFKNGRKFHGYVEAGSPSALIRLIDLSPIQQGPQRFPSPPLLPALQVWTKRDKRGESCFGWGESAAIQEGVKQFLAGHGGSKSGGKETGPASKGTTTTRHTTYRSLNRPPYWGVERMGRVWAEILMSVNQTISADNNEPTSKFEASADSTSSGHASGAQMASKDTVLTSLIPVSLALLPCNPTFLMARDAFIQADQIIFGGNHICDLWRGFAGRGLGISAHGATETMWTPWGGGKRKDGLDMPEKCNFVGRKGTPADAMKIQRDEL